MNRFIISAIFLLIFLVSCNTKKEVEQKNSTQEGNSGGHYTLSRYTQKNDFFIVTPDDKDISVNYYYKGGEKDSLQPVIVLIHQFRENKEQWSDSAIDLLINSKYKVLSYDIRGHGKSSKVDYNIDTLLTDPNEAPNDLKAVFNWLKTQKGVDSSRIGVLGTSIGGNLGCYARYHLRAKAVVSVSGSKAGFYAYMKFDDRLLSRVLLRISNVFLICGINDGTHADDAKFLYDNFLMDPKQIKVYDSDKHGIFLIRQFPEIYDIAITWFKKNL